MSHCVTWWPKTYMLIFATSDIVFPLRYLNSPSLPGYPNIDADILIVWHCLSPPLLKVPMRYLVTQNIHADIRIVWNSLTARLPTIPLRYLVTQNIDADILIVCHCLSLPLPKVPLRYLVTQNIHADICLYWLSLSAPLPTIPIALPGYPKSYMLIFSLSDTVSPVRYL